MAAKAITPEQAKQFHMAMTGYSHCFDGCCLCRLNIENAALKEYATHKPGCYENDDLCICGLDALLTKEPG